MDWLKKKKKGGQNNNKTPNQNTALPYNSPLSTGIDSDFS